MDLVKLRIRALNGFFGLGGLGCLLRSDMYGGGRRPVVVLGFGCEFRHDAIRGVDILGPVAVRSIIVPDSTIGALLQVRHAVVAPVVLCAGKQTKISVYLST